MSTSIFLLLSSAGACNNEKEKEGKKERNKE